MRNPFHHEAKITDPGPELTEEVKASIEHEIQLLGARIAIIGAEPTTRENLKSIEKIRGVIAKQQSLLAAGRHTSKAEL